MGVYYSHCLIPKDNTIRPSPEQIAALLAAWVDQRFIVVAGASTGIAPTWRNKAMAETGACFRTEPPLVAPIKQERPEPEPPKSFWKKLFQSPAPTVRAPAPDPMTPFSIPPIGVSWASLSQPDALIEWKSNPDALYPMDTIADHVADPHSISIELSDDFVNPYTDAYDAGEDTKQLDGICRCGFDLRFESNVGWIDSNRIRRICPRCGEAFRPQDHLAEIIDGATAAKIPQPGGLCRRFAISIYFGRDHPIYRRAANGEFIDAKPRTSELFLKTCETALGCELNGFEDYS